MFKFILNKVQCNLYIDALDAVFIVYA